MFGDLIRPAISFNSVTAFLPLVFNNREIAMSKPNINSENLTISKLFSNTYYVVPDYQREFVWRKEEVRQLIDDIESERNTDDNDEPQEYFIGSIVVCPMEGGKWEVIDGQQRLTTLYLILCAAQNYLVRTDQGDELLTTLKNLTFSSSILSGGSAQKNYTLELQYEESTQFIKDIANGSQTPPSNKKSPASLKKLNDAYSVIQDFINNELGDLNRFLGYLLNDVRLIRIETESISRALDIFETINERGISLDSVDLLKNLLFRKNKSEDSGRLQKLWGEIRNIIINEIHEKPLRVLRYFTLSSYKQDAGEKLSGQQLFKWYSKHANDLLGGRVIDYTSDLLEASKVYENIWKHARDPQGKDCPQLISLKVLGGGSTRQHLILLLAGRHLPSDLFARLVSEVENLIFVYFMAGFQAKYWEPKFIHWADSLRQVKTQSQLNSWADAYIVPEKKRWSLQFETGFLQLGIDADVSGVRAPLSRIRYVLAKLYHYIQTSAYKAKKEMIPFESFIDAQQFHVEHIFPQEPEEDASREFGEYQDEKVIHRIGNLLLIEGSLNSSIQNEAYSLKKEVYAKSSLLMTKCVAEKIKIGNTRIDKVANLLKQYSKWNEHAVESRQRELLNLACSTWDIPK